MGYQIVEFRLRLSDEMVSKWCKAKGYQPMIPAASQTALLSMPPQQVGEMIPNPETEAQFFQRVGREEEKGVCLNPITNQIYQDNNAAVQAEVEYLRNALEENMEFTVTAESTEPLTKSIPKVK